tara:strand:+ start:499 stop:1008 length:510 start_codon:yes stop_codon:yes gene_type:complete
MSTLSVDTIQGKTTAGTVAMPAGMVVQTAFQTFNTQTVLSSDSDADVGGSSLSFTPKFASSLLLLSYDLHVNLYRLSTDAQGGTINFVVDSVNISHSSQDYENYNLMPSSGTFNDYRRIHKEVSISATNTNTKTIKLTGRPFATGGSGQIIVNISNDFISSMKVQEIAQ